MSNSQQVRSIVATTLQSRQLPDAVEVVSFIAHREIQKRKANSPRQVVGAIRAAIILCFPGVRTL